LVAGSNVTLEDGRVINPEQVLIGERKPGPVSTVHSFYENNNASKQI